MHNCLFSVFVHRNTLRKGNQINYLMAIKNIYYFEYLFLSHFLQCIRKVSKYIGQQNERIYNPKGLQITDPTYRGLRVIEISILDRPGRT